MIHLSHILSVELTYCQDLGASKKKVLQTISEKLSAALLGVSDTQIFDQFIARERLGSTGIGSGVAVPHCRLSGIHKPHALLAKIPHPIDFDSIDQKPVDIIFALIVPEEESDEHLQLLAKVAERANDQNFLRKLRSSIQDKELYTTFIEYQSSI